MLHPVVDLNINPLAPLVIERAISDNSELAIPLLKQQIDGLQNQNIITTITDKNLYFNFVFITPLINNIIKVNIKVLLIKF